MAGPFRGPEGLYAGWAEWTRHVDLDDDDAAGADRARGRPVLLLGTLPATLGDGPAGRDAPSAPSTRSTDERIVRIEHFLDQDQARRAAGARVPEPQSSFERA